MLAVFFRTPFLHLLVRCGHCQVLQERVSVLATQQVYRITSLTECFFKCEDELPTSLRSPQVAGRIGAKHSAFLVIKSCISGVTASQAECQFQEHWN